MDAVRIFLVYLIIFQGYPKSALALNPDESQDKCFSKAGIFLEWVGAVVVDAHYLTFKYHWVLQKASTAGSCPGSLANNTELNKEMTNRIDELIGNSSPPETYDYNIFDSLCSTHADFCPKGEIGRQKRFAAILAGIAGIIGVGAGLWGGVTATQALSKVEEVKTEQAAIIENISRLEAHVKAIEVKGRALTAYLAAERQELDISLSQSFCNLEQSLNIKVQANAWMLTKYVQFQEAMRDAKRGIVSPTLLPEEFLRVALHKNAPGVLISDIDISLIYESGIFQLLSHSRKHLIISGYMMLPIARRSSVMPLYRVINMGIPRSRQEIQTPSLVGIVSHVGSTVIPILTSEKCHETQKISLCRVDPDADKEAKCLAEILNGTPMSASCIRLSSKRAQFETMTSRHLIIKGRAGVKHKITSGSITKVAPLDCSTICCLSLTQIDTIDITASRTYHGYYTKGTPLTYHVSPLNLTHEVYVFSPHHGMEVPLLNFTDISLEWIHPETRETLVRTCAIGSAVMWLLFLIVLFCTWIYYICVFCCKSKARN